MPPPLPLPHLHTGRPFTSALLHVSTSLLGHTTITVHQNFSTTFDVHLIIFKSKTFKGMVEIQSEVQRWKGRDCEPVGMPRGDHDYQLRSNWLRPLIGATHTTLKPGERCFASCGNEICGTLVVNMEPCRVLCGEGVHWKPSSMANISRNTIKQ